MEIGLDYVKWDPNPKNPKELAKLLQDAQRLRWTVFCLDLSGSKIRALPDSVGRLSNLKTLDLSGCHLKRIPYGVVALGLPFVTDGVWDSEGVNLTGVTLDEGNLQLFAQPRETIEAYYQSAPPSELEQLNIQNEKCIFV